MARFNEVVNHPDNGTVDVGPGLRWDNVYNALNGTGVNVVGGRVSGVGVAGFALGGGYSYKTAQYGITLDNIASFELVLPNGTITTVTPESEPDLWFGVRVCCLPVLWLHMIYYLASSRVDSITLSVE